MGRLGLAKEKAEVERRLFLALRDIGGAGIGSVEEFAAALRRHGLRLRLTEPLKERQKLMTIGGVCAKGHVLTEKTVTLEGRRGGKKYVRCKQCISNRKKLSYSTPLHRKLRIAYNHWFRCGHPEGLLWPEIKERILKETNHGQSSPVELSGVGPRHEGAESTITCPQPAGVDRLECEAV